jgi:hypothetical protein
MSVFRSVNEVKKPPEKRVYHNNTMRQLVAVVVRLQNL